MQAEDNFNPPSVPDLEQEERAVGGEALVQTFYEGPEKCDCCTNWVEREPKDVPEEVKERYDRAAIQVFKIKDHGSLPATFGGLGTMKNSLIEIQSQIISDIIRPVLTDVGMLIAKNETIKIRAPFRELYFAYPRILEIQHNYAEGSEGRKHLEVLIKVMKELLSDISAEIAELHSKKAITFQYLWTIFPKGIIVYSHQKGRDKLYQVVGVDRTSFGHVELRYVIFDGSKYGMHETSFCIPWFKDEKLISKLPLQPVGYHADPHLEQKMAERGKLALAYQDMICKEYTGIAYDASVEGHDEVSRYRATEHVSIKIIPPKTRGG